MKLFVPILVNEEIGKERDKKLFSVKSEKHNFMNINGFQKPRELLKRLESYFHPYFFSIGLHDDRRKPFVQFDSCSENLNSISLGVFCSAYATAKDLKFKEKYDSITITGNFEIVKNEVHLLDVVEIEQKFEAVQKYVQENITKRHLFIYVSNEEFISEGLHENNIFVIHFSSDSKIEYILAEIFEPDFTEGQKKSVNNLFIRNEFIESKTFINWKRELVKSDCGGFLIHGKSNTGKSVIAKELCKYLLITKKADDIVWISINDNAYFWNLLREESQNRFSNLVQTESIIKSTYLQEFEKLDFFIKQNKKVILAFDNIEYSFVDDILDFLLRNYDYAKSNLKLILTSWEECKYKQNLVFFNLLEKNIIDVRLNRLEFEAVILSTINSQFFKSKYYDSDKYVKKQLFDLLYEQCREGEIQLPGLIIPSISPLEKTDIQDLIERYKEQDIKSLYEKVKIFRLQFEVIDLFAQIVLFAYLATKDFAKDINAKEIIEIINSKIFSVSFKDRPILTFRNIKFALKDLEQAALLQKTATDKYLIKNDYIKYCVFSSAEKKEITNELSRIRDTIISVEKKIEYAIENNLYTEFEKYIENYDSKDKINEFVIKICEFDCTISFFEKIFNRDIDTNYVDKDGHSPVDVYCCCGHSLDVLKLLLKKGFSFSNDLGNGTDALILAVNKGNYEIIEYLLSHYYKNNYSKYYFNYFTIIQFYTFRGTDSKIFELLEKYINGLNSKTKNGWTLLQCAALNPSSQLLKYILEKNYFSDIDELATMGGTALQMACGCGSNPKNVELLIEYGANTKILTTPRKQNILHLAAINNNSEILDFLLNNNFDEYLNRKNWNNQTPLELALELENDMGLTKNVDLLRRYQKGGYV